MTSATSEDSEQEETGPFYTGLWAHARYWAEWCVALFPPQETALVGASRRMVLRCRGWLWAAEALVRRLIIGAALAFDAAGLPALRRRPAHGAAAAAPGSARRTDAAFIVLSLRGAGAVQPSQLSPHQPAQQSSQPARTTSAPAHRHIRFPLDDLLHLMRRQAPRAANPAPRPHLNPLHRRGRISRFDPLYLPPQDDDDWQRDMFRTRGSEHDCTRPEAPTPSRALPTPRSPWWRPQDEPEWRRIDREWDRVIPAPGLARRLIALDRVLDRPERAIRRLARRLQRASDLAALIRVAPPPILRRPRCDRQRETPLLPEIAEAQAAFQPPDTS